MVPPRLEGTLLPHWDTGVASVHSQGATTQSLVMRSKSGTVRRIDARHRLRKLSEFSAIEFD